MDRNEKGQFVKGIKPWNTGTKGIMKPNATSFKKGQKGIQWVPVGTLKLRVRTTRNDTRWFRKIAEPNVWTEEAKYVWEHNNGPIPKGMLVHHKDRDKLNDKIENLELKSRAGHINEHRKEFRRNQ